MDLEGVLYGRAGELAVLYQEAEPVVVRRGR